jgi:hypothetical protein
VSAATATQPRLDLGTENALQALRTRLAADERRAAAVNPRAAASERKAAMLQTLRDAHQAIRDKQPVRAERLLDNAIRALGG